jgi:hypothetical protein
MFGGRKRRISSSQTPNSEPAWNGWTSSLLDAINGRDRLEFDISAMTVTWSFDAARFSDAVHLDELDLQSRHEMPGIADEPPIRVQDHTPYPAIEATLQGHEIDSKVVPEIEIRQTPKKYPLAYVAKKGLVGHASISATDFVGICKKGQEFRTPVISVKIHEDVDCQLLSALRNSFLATRSRGTKPRLRIFLSKKFDASVLSLLDNEVVETVGIKQVIVWETWE